MLNIKNQVQKTYNEIGVYFSKTRRYVWPEIKPYLDKLKESERVLDLGCGNGRILQGIRPETEYLGVDFSKTLTNEAERMHPSREFIVGDITKPSLWKKIPGKFDAVFLVAVLHHIPSRKEQVYILKEAAKRVKKGGYIYISVWNLWQLKYLMNHVKSLRLKTQNPRWLHVPFQRKWLRFCYAFGRGELFMLVRDSGLGVKEIYYADSMGKKTDFLKGRNLVVVAGL